MPFCFAYRKQANCSSVSLRFMKNRPNALFCFEETLKILPIFGLSSRNQLAT